MQSKGLIEMQGVVSLIGDIKRVTNGQFEATHPLYAYAQPRYNRDGEDKLRLTKATIEEV